MHDASNYRGLLQTNIPCQASNAKVALISHSASSFVVLPKWNLQYRNCCHIALRISPASLSPTFVGWQIARTHFYEITFDLLGCRDMSNQGRSDNSRQIKLWLENWSDFAFHVDPASLSTTTGGYARQIQQARFKVSGWWDVFERLHFKKLSPQQALNAKVFWPRFPRRSHVTVS